MIVSDLIVEVRDRNLTRVAQFTDDDLAGLTIVMRANTVGAWEAVLPATILQPSGEVVVNPVAEALRVEGAGIIVTTTVPSTTTLLSGPMTEVRFSATADNAGGAWTVTGVSDAILLADAISFPEPSNANPATQAVSNDQRTGTAEDLLRAYVNLNIGTAAPAARRVGLRSLFRLQGASQGRGPTLSFSPRFDNLLELCQSIATQGGLLFDVVQVGSFLEFVVSTPSDRSRFVSMDVDNEQLATVGLGLGAPSTTLAVVAGQGEGILREIISVNSSTALAAETAWGRRIERFVDQRQAELTAELTQKGDEIISVEGKTVASVKATPSDAIVDSFMADWKVGDRVTIVVRNSPISVPVSEVAMGVSEQGVALSATFGDPTGFEPEDLAFTRQSNTETRVSALERNAETGAAPDLTPRVNAVETRVTTLEGSPTFTGTPTAPALRLTSTTAVSTSSTAHAFQVGATTAANLTASATAVQARSNGAVAALTVNGLGGNVTLGSSASTVSAPGTVSMPGTVTLGSTSTTVSMPGRLDATHLPFAMATGRVTHGSGTTAIASMASSGALTVTFPSGRFTQPPNINVTPSSARLTAAYSETSLTATSVTVTLDNWSNNTAAAPIYARWTATQMTSGSAFG
jgi:hypothetical protein